MSDVNANIGIQFDTANALAQLRQLQAGLSKFNQALTEGNVAAANAQKGLNAQLVQSINATGKFVASQKTIASSTASFTDALEKNKLSMTQYFKFTGAAATMNSKMLKGFFAKEKEILTRASKDRVKALQTQYVQLSNAQGDLVKVLQIVPKHLKMVNGQYADYATRTQMAAQRQQFLNQLLKQGSTQLLNFGKNTQWAGRQLMVGLTIPLTMLGSTAAKAFREMEQATVKFTRVYGDMVTSVADTDNAVKSVQELAKEFTKFGIAAVDTMNMAAEAAAMGLTGNALTAQITNATKLAVLGQVSQQEALATTISLQNAFGVSADELAKKINYLNAVENQTVLSISDLTTAIPKAGPVVKQLGGSVEDLAFFMTAMKEGGINASEGANALKSGLASMINPSKKASDFLASLGVNIKGIVNANAGDLKGTVLGFAKALDTLAPLERSRAIEQLFGKFQFARISTLFQNITKEGSQASRAFGLAGASVEELAILSERELGKVENSVGVKFQKTLEDLKIQLLPIGKAFLEAITPVVKFAGKILEKFNNLSEGTKKFVVGTIAVLGGIAPVVLMTVGLIANGAANLIKFFAMLRGGMAKLNGQNNVLGGGFDYLTQAEIDNLAQSEALHTSHQELISTFNVEKGAVDALAASYATAASQARALASGSPGLFNAVPGPAGAVSGLPKKFAQGGVVPGTGNGDTVPSMLTPGEVVLTKDTVRQNPELVAGLLNGNVKRYAFGTGDENGGMKSPQTSRVASVPQLMGLDIENFAKEIAKLAGTPGTQASTIREIRSELEKATTRAGKDVADTIKEMLATAAQTVDKATASWVKDAVRDINPATGQQYREPYSSKASTGGFVFAHGAKNANDRGEAVHDPEELRRRAELSGDTTSGIGRFLNMAADNGGSAFGLSNFGFMFPEEANKKKTGGEFVMPKDQVADLFTGPNAARTLSPILEEWARVQGLTLEEAMTDPARAQELKGVIDRYGAAIGEEINAIPGKFDEEAFYAAVERANARVEQADTLLRTSIDNLLVESNMSITTKDPSAKVVRTAVPQKATALREDLGLPTKTVLPDGTEIKPVSGYGGKNERFLSTGNKIDEARASGALLGDAVIAGVRGAEGTDAASPSKKGVKAGKEVGDGLVKGMQESEASVRSQAEQLGSASVPTASETTAKVDKMDLANKAFYDDLNNPDLYDERQSLKSQDRNRRKRGATRTVDASYSETPVVATEDPMLVVVKQQMSEANKAEIDAAKARMHAAELEMKKARETVFTAEQDKVSEAELATAKKKALEAEKRYEEARQKAIQTVRDNYVDPVKTREPDYVSEVPAKQQVGDGSIEQEAAVINQRIKEQEALRDQVKAQAKEAGRTRKAQNDLTNATKKSAKAQAKNADSVKQSTVATVNATEQIAENKTSELSASERAAMAQTESAGNLVTANELEQQIVDNKEISVGNGDAINKSENETKQSEASIAESNDQIEANKKRQAAEGMAAVNSPIPLIPDGSQSTSKYVDPSKALGYQEAYELAMGRDPNPNDPNDKGSAGYTRNRKGQFIMDPETGQPTTLSQRAITKKKRGMRREKVGKFSGKVSGGLGTAAMVAGMVGAPPQVTAALGAGATVAQFAPMLAGMGPVGWAVAGIAAVGAGAYLFNKHLTAMSTAAAKFVRDTSATTEKMIAVGKITGKVGSSELMDRKNQNTLFQDYNEVQREGRGFGNKFLKSDIGKEISKSVQDNMLKNGNEAAAKDLARQLAFYVSDGVMTGEQANSVAEQIGVNLKSQTFGVNVKGSLVNLIGADGNDLFKDPVKARVRLISDNIYRGSQFVEKAMSDGSLDRKEAATIQAQDANSVMLAQAQADAIQRIYLDKKKALELELAGTTNKERQVQLENQIASLTKQNLLDTQKMNTQVGFAIAQAEMKFNDLLIKNQNDSAFDASRDAVTQAYKGTKSEGAAKTFLKNSKNYDDTGGFASKAEGQTFQYKMEMLVGNKVMSPEQANAMTKLFEGKLPELNAAINLGIKKFGTDKTFAVLDMFSGFENKEVGRDFVANIIRKNPDEFEATAKTIASLQALSGEEINIEATLTLMGTEGLDLMTARLKEIEGWKDKEVNIKTITEFAEKNNINSPELQAMMKEDWFVKMKPGEQKEVIQKYTQLHQSYAYMDAETAKTLATQRAQMELYERYGASSGDAKYKIELEQLVTTYSKEILDVNKSATTATRDYFSKSSLPEAKIPPVGAGAGGGTKDNPLQFLDALAMRIKMVRDQSFNAQKPIKSMLEAFRNPAAKKNVADMFKLFDGLQQRLIALKAPKEFRDYIAGLSADDLEKLKNADADPTKKGKQSIFTYAQKKDKNGKIVEDRTRITGFTESGKAIMAAYNEAPLDSFNIAQREVIADTNNQFKAFTLLKSQGVETNAALAAVEDSATAAAIASGALAKTDLKTFVTDVNNANNALQKQQVITELIKKNADFKFKAESMPKLASALKDAKYSSEQIQTVLSDPNLAKQLIDDLADGKIDSEAISTYLNSIKDEKIVEIKGKFNAGDFAGAARPGMELVNKMFSAQEQLLRTGVDGRTTGIVKRLDEIKKANEKDQLAIQKIQIETLKPLEDQLAKAQRTMDLTINRKIEEYQKQIDKAQRVIEIAFERPIADIQERNALLSHDLEVMAHAAQEINDKYDKQVEALDAVEKVNQRILRQQQQQLGLADALSQGDIAAAARAAQEMRAANAADLATATRDSLQAARDTEINSLVGGSTGLTRKQMEEEQYQNAQRIYALENTATTNYNGQLLTRVQLLDQIQSIQDQIYAKEQERIAQQTAITALEDQIYNINQDKVKPLQDAMDVRNLEAATAEATLQSYIDGIQVLGKSKSEWDAITAKIDASELAGQEFDKTLGMMLASTQKIDEGWKGITATLDKYGKVTTEVADAQKQTSADALKAEQDAAKLRLDAIAAQEKAMADYNKKKAEYDADVADLKSMSQGGYTMASYAQQRFNAKWKNGAPVKPVFGPTSAADNFDVSYNNPNVNIADQMNAANLKTNKTYTGKSTGGTGSSSGGGSGSGTSGTGSGTKTTTTTGTPGSASQGVPGTAGYKPGSYKYVPVTVDKTQLKPDAATMAIKTAGGKTGITEEIARLRQLRVDMSKNIYKKYGIGDKYGSATAAQLKSALPGVAAKDKAAAQALIKELEDTEAYFLGFWKQGKQDTTDQFVAQSDSAKKFRKQKYDALSPEVKKQVDILKTAVSDFTTDHQKLASEKSNMKSVADKYGYGQYDTPAKWKNDTRKDAIADLNEAYEKLQYAKDNMKDRNLLVDNARMLLKRIGFTNENAAWLFSSANEDNPTTNILTDEKTSMDDNVGNWKAYASGGLVASTLSSKRFTIGTDTVPAMLTPGEFVMSKYAVNNHGVDTLKAINAGASVGDSVYNYNLSVNVRSDASPDEIARTVMAQIKQIDSQRIRGNRL